MEMHPFGRLLPALVARARLLRSVRPIERSETVAIEDGFDRVAVATIRAPFPVPGFARATWDGYAVRSRETRSATPRAPVRLRLVGEAFAEGGFSGRLGPGEALAIATGAAVPPGADGIVIFEEAGRRVGTVDVSRPVQRGDRIAPAGHDFPRGALLVRSGTVLDAVGVGTLASCGIPRVRVYARPRVAVLPNGNELLVPGERPRRGRIFESNNVTTASVVRAAGGVPRLARPLPDDPAAIEEALRAALASSDAVLATGGSSVGERDHLPRIVRRLGSPLFHGVAVRPGKPTLAARAGAKVIVGLPGHPASCLSNLYWLVLPALRKLARRPGPGWEDRWAVLARAPPGPSRDLTTVVPLALREGRAYPTFRGSSALTSLEGAVAFTLVPPGGRPLRAGRRIQVSVLDPPLGRRDTPSARGNG